MIGAIQLALNQLGSGPLYDALKAIGQALDASAAAAGQAVNPFGTGALGNVTLTGAVTNFSGLLDFKTLIVDPGAVLTPAPGQVTFIRATQAIVFNGTYQGDAVFPGGENLISLGSSVASGAGGGGGGGASDTGQGGDGNYPNQNGGGGGGAGYTGGMDGSPGNGGGSGNPGSNGTTGVPGVADPFFQETSLAIFPGVLSVVTGTVPGQQGEQGGQGGNGAFGSGGQGGNPGNGGNGGQGGAGGGLVILAAPSITFGGTAVFHLDGGPGVAGRPGDPGGAANASTNGGGGGGGGGGSGGQGGCGGFALVYFNTIVDNGVTYSHAPGAGAAGGAAGVGGASDGLGTPGAMGGTGAPGAAGSVGFTLLTPLQ